MTTNNIFTFAFSDKKGVAMSATKAFELISSHGKKAAHELFMVATLSAYCQGVTIPAYTTSNGTDVPATTITKALKGQELYNEVRRAKSTISEDKKYISFIIENELFGKFASGELLYSPKLTSFIIDNKDALTASHELVDLFDYNIDALKSMLTVSADDTNTTSKGKNVKNDNDDNDGQTADDDGDNEDFQADDKIVRIVWDDKAYDIPESILKKYATAVDPE